MLKFKGQRYKSFKLISAIDVVKQRMILSISIKPSVREEKPYSNIFR